MTTFKMETPELGTALIHITPLGFGCLFGMDFYPKPLVSTGLGHDEEMPLPVMSFA